MAQRRFGPVRGAGVAIIEKEGEKPIEPGALGWAGYAGIFEKGPVGEMNLISKKSNFLKIMGDVQEGTLAPDAALDYYDLANGAGGLVLVRVTDGNELQASANLYARIASIRAPMGVLKAHNGGRWGGKALYHTDDLALIGDLTNTTLDTGNATFKADQWKGGFIEIEDVPNVRYPIVGNDAAGVITVASDQTMIDDYDALSGTSLRYFLTLETEDKAVSFLIGDGEDSPNSEFSLSVFVDGDFVRKYPNLHTDPAHKRYWVDLINDDGSNSEVEAVNLWTGAHVAAVRPANHYGLIDTVTATLLTAIIHDFVVSSPTSADPSVVLGSTTDAMLEQAITVTIDDGATDAFTAVSDRFGALGSGVIATPFTPNNKWSPPFDITENITPLETGDVITINYKPFVADSLIEGRLYPDKPNAKRTFFRIVDNDHKSIVVAAGSDLTADGAPADEFLVEAALDMEAGRDGNADIVDADYEQQAWDTASSPFNRTNGKNLGLVKFATPGITATAVQKAGKAYAEAKNHQYRYEVPSNITTESGVLDYINDTLGRSDFAVVSFPSYGYVSDPLGEGEGKLKLVSMTGMIHGREAQIATAFEGFHKAEAGLEATLPSVLKIATGEAVLDEELLNPSGIGVIKKLKGNFVLWGDRTLHLDPAWKFKHQRELMSYYEHVLQESFDFIIFAINDPITEKDAIASLNSFFFPEFVKRALRGATFREAAIIKIDAENNTAATRNAGDLNAEILLQLADTVERFKITIGKQGIFESVG